MASCIEQLKWCTQTRRRKQAQASDHGPGTELVQLPISEQPKVTDDNQANTSSGHSPNNEIKQGALIFVYPTISPLRYGVSF